jgi:hypothetical protein
MKSILKLRSFKKKKNNNSKHKRLEDYHSFGLYNTADLAALIREGHFCSLAHRRPHFGTLTQQACDRRNHTTSVAAVSTRFRQNKKLSLWTQKI